MPFGRLLHYELLLGLSLGALLRLTEVLLVLPVDHLVTLADLVSPDLEHALELRVPQRLDADLLSRGNDRGNCERFGRKPGSVEQLGFQETHVDHEVGVFPNVPGDPWVGRRGGGQAGNCGADRVR